VNDPDGQAELRASLFTNPAHLQSLKLKGHPSLEYLSISRSNVLGDQSIIEDRMLDGLGQLAS